MHGVYIHTFFSFHLCRWLTKDFRSEGRLSIGSTGHKNMYIGVGLGGSSLDAKGGIVGGTIELSKIDTYSEDMVPSQYSIILLPVKVKRYYKRNVYTHKFGYIGIELPSHRLCCQYISFTTKKFGSQNCIYIQTQYVCIIIIQCSAATS